MNEWISVKDKLPEFVTYAGNMRWSKEVLCFLAKDNFVIAFLTNMASPFDEIHMRASQLIWKNWEANMIVPFENVKYWMPLPNPPEEVIK